MCHNLFGREVNRLPSRMDTGFESCDGKCVTEICHGCKCVTSPSLQSLAFCDFSTDEGPKNGGSIARRPWNAMNKACRHIAVVAPAMGTLERRVQNACLDEVLAGGAATTTHGLQATTMHRTIVHAAKLVNHAVISAGHASRTVA